MGCEECGSGDAREVAVEFTDGTRRTIRLCEACREAYRDGTLVERAESE